MSAINGLKSFWDKEWVRITGNSIFIIVCSVIGFFSGKDSAPVFYKYLIATMFLTFIVTMVTQTVKRRKNKKTIPKQNGSLENFITSAVCLVSISVAVALTEVTHSENPVRTFFIIFFRNLIIVGFICAILHPLCLPAVWRKIRRKQFHYFL